MTCLPSAVVPGPKPYMDDRVHLAGLEQGLTSTRSLEPGEAAFEGAIMVPATLPCSM